MQIWPRRSEHRHVVANRAQGAAPLHALISASYLYARAGEERAKELSYYGVMPFDIIEGVKKLLNEM